MEYIPDTLISLVFTFLLQPTVISVSFFIFYLIYINNFTYLDILIYPSVFFFWCINEWFIHKYLLHNKYNFYIKRYHKYHHSRKYYHISIDNPFLIWSWILFYYKLFNIILYYFNLDLYLTNIMIPYILSGFTYMFLHYSAHCKYVPNNKYWKYVIDHHKDHHSKNINKNYSFILPFLDNFFNTKI